MLLQALARTTKALTEALEGRPFRIFVKGCRWPYSAPRDVMAGPDRMA